MRFWDSSAVVPLLVAEPSAGRMLELLQQDGAMLVWWGTAVECVSAIARREREAHLPVAQATEAIERLRALARGWHEMLPSEAIRSVAQRLLRVHPLRAADALQLAAASVAADHAPATLGFVCLDERLAEAALKEGFQVLGGE